MVMEIRDFSNLGSEEKHRLLAGNTLNVIWLMDMSLTFFYVNPAIEQVLGFKPEEWVGT